MTEQIQTRSWRYATEATCYLISTNTNLLSHSFIQSAFASSDMYWARPLSDSELSALLASSLNLGLYIIHPPADLPPPRTVSEPSSPRDTSPTVELPNPIGGDETKDSTTAVGVGSGEGEETYNLEQIGFARFVTDHLTTFWLTDVYTAPEHRGKGLGKWLIACCRDIIKDAKHLRRAALIASPEVGKKFYEKELGMHDVAEDSDKVACMTLTSPWLLHD